MNTKAHLGPTLKQHQRNTAYRFVFPFPLICYGTENNNDNGFQVPPYVVLKKTQIKKLIVTLPSSFTHYGYGCLAREATLSKRSPHATTQPLPFIYSSFNHNGAKRRKKAPLLISNGELNKPQDTTDSDASSVNESLSEVLNIALPQYSGSGLYDICLVVNTLIIKLLLHTLPPPSSCLLLKIDEGLDLEELTNNFKQYELWGGPQENNNLDDVNTIDGSSYVISRSPFDPIGRPCNPFGPIERPLPHLPSSCELADLGFVSEAALINDESNRRLQITVHGSTSTHVRQLRRSSHTCMTAKKTVDTLGWS
ncbi:hypothetical protein YC2023_008330 [Brassica napus]